MAKIINITDINIKEVRIMSVGSDYKVSVLYSQVADDGVEFQQKTMEIPSDNALIKGRLGKVLESAILQVKQDEEI